jgi:hypothetical protein
VAVEVEVQQRAIHIEQDGIDLSPINHCRSSLKE